MYILQRSRISTGAVRQQLLERGEGALELALLQQLHGGLVVLESGSCGRGGVAVRTWRLRAVDFLRLGAADRASCVMVLPGARLPYARFEPDRYRLQARVRE